MGRPIWLPHFTYHGIYMCNPIWLYRYKYFHKLETFFYTYATIIKKQTERICSMGKEAHVLVVLPLEARHQALLEAAAPGASFCYRTLQTVTPEDLEDATILIGQAPPQICHHAKKLEWYQCHASGPDAYLKEGVIRPEALVTSATGSYGAPVSEHMLALTLSLLKLLHLYRDAQHEHLWKIKKGLSSLHNSNVLIVGLGDLGTNYAKLCSFMGAHVTGVRRSIAPKPEYVEEIYTNDKLDELLPYADIVALCLPASDETLHLFDGRRLNLMKPGSLLINGGRGTAVDLNALTNALNSGHLAGAGLDVTDPEPLPPDHPLWDVPTAIITPHIAGGFALPGTMDRIVGLAAENLKRFFDGQPLKNLMDRKTWDRKS